LAEKSSIRAKSLKLSVYYPEHYRKSGFKLKGVWLWICPVVGILMVVFFSIIILYDLNSPLKVGSFFLFIVTGSAYYFTRKKYLLSKGIKLVDLYNHGQTWDT